VYVFVVFRIMRIQDRVNFEIFSLANA